MISQLMSTYFFRDYDFGNIKLNMLGGALGTQKFVLDPPLIMKKSRARANNYSKKMQNFQTFAGLAKSGFSEYGVFTKWSWPPGAYISEN